VSARAAAEALLLNAFARLDRVALGVATGVLLGLTIFLATAALLLKGGPEVGPTLALLAQFFPGYRVTPLGSVVGLAYGLASGFVVGWITAAVYNLAVAVYLAAAKLREQAESIGPFMDAEDH